MGKKKTTRKTQFEITDAIHPKLINPELSADNNHEKKKEIEIFLCFIHNKSSSDVS